MAAFIHMLLRPERHRLLAASLLASLAAALELLPYWLLYHFALVFEGPTLDAGIPWLLAGALLLAGCARLATFGYANILSHQAAFGIVRHLRQRILERLQDSDACTIRTRQGDLRKTLIDDIAGLEHLIGHTLPDAVSGLCVPALAALLLFWLDAWLALSALALLPLAWLAHARSFQGLSDILHAWHNADAAASTGMIGYTRGMATLKAHHRQASSLRHLTEVTQQLARLAEQVTNRTAIPYALFFCLLSGTLLTVLPVGLWRYAHGWLDLPTLLLFIALGGGQTLALLRTVAAHGALQKRRASLGRIREALSLPAQPIPEPRPLSTACGDIRFHAVRAPHADMTTPPLDLTLRQGSVTVLTGRSGVGKSTLLGMILRAPDPVAGHVSIGGVDLRCLQPDALRRRIAWVGQSPVLFGSSLRQQLLLARPDASEAQLHHAIHICKLEALVASLPGGLDSPLAHGRHRLSGGERQRIALARAVIKDADIWLLDEITSAIDPETECAIVAALSTLLPGKTALIITHRPPLLALADRVLRLESGHLASSHPIFHDQTDR